MTGKRQSGAGRVARITNVEELGGRNIQGSYPNKPVMVCLTGDALARQKDDQRLTRAYHEALKRMCEFVEDASRRKGMDIRFLLVLFDRDAPDDFIVLTIRDDADAMLNDLHNAFQILSPKQVHGGVMMDELAD
jgi:hypothetical protein